MNGAAMYVIDENVIIRWGMAVLLAFFVVFGAWAAFAPLSAAVIGNGFVKVDSNRKTIQHLEGGIIRRILVKDGDHVSQGQPLLVLGDVQVSASVDLLNVMLDAELAKEARLMAEKEMHDLRFPQGLLSRAKDAKVARLLAAETQLFRARSQAVHGQIQLLRQQVTQMQDEIAGISAQLNAEERAIGFMKDELRSNEALIEKQFIQKTRLMNLQRDLAIKEADQQEHVADLSRARQKVLELERQIVSLKSDYMQKAANDLELTTQKIHDLQERLLPSEDELQRQQVTAPVAGTVVGLRFHTVGGVVGPKEPVMDLVPDSQDLIVEAHIAVDDVDEVKPGMAADIRFTAYKQRSTALVDGKVSYVSPDRMTDEQGKSAYYVVHVQIGKETLARVHDIELQPGMQAEVYLRTRSRTLLEYLMEPITSTMRKSLRES